MWDAFLQHLSNCGRDATLFIVALGGMVGIGVLAHAMGDRVSPYILVPILVVLLALAMRAIGKRMHWERLGKMPPLQREDIRRVRSKLVKNKTNLSYERRMRPNTSRDRGVARL